ncbi:hypothetical protein OS493_012272 [Desmophyllum pertusum]|uniref:Uncharacterized protein n=1 Tax=Desmophyllum pertusum TaxID=174260 RepID=A0A9W9ZTZ7_9CNID|nr:hypothetical protein OS493_012272 [Desmophyllum pertusum]
MLRLSPFWLLLVCTLFTFACSSVNAWPSDENEGNDSESGNHGYEGNPSLQGHINKLTNALRKATRKGGRQLKALLAKWSGGKSSTWNFKIYYNEIDCLRQNNENNELRRGKRKLADDLQQEKCKKAKIENKLKESQAKIHQITGNYKKKFKRLTQKLIKLQREQSHRGSAKKKTFGDYSKRHQTRLRKQMVTDCETSLSFLALNGFVATKIEVFNHDTQEYETISLIDEEATAVSFRTETLTNEEIDEINLLLYTKERFMISNEAYHELSMVCKDLPRSWKIQDRIKELNRKWNLFPTPGNTNGVQQSIKDRLEIRLKALIKNTPQMHHSNLIIR